jgi:hypothetical protein
MCLLSAVVIIQRQGAIVSRSGVESSFPKKSLIGLAGSGAAAAGAAAAGTAS